MAQRRSYRSTITRVVVQRPYTLENVARAMDELLGAHQGIGARAEQ
jgi:hypothetical protein